MNFLMEWSLWWISTKWLLLYFTLQNITQLLTSTIHKEWDWDQAKKIVNTTLSTSLILLMPTVMERKITLAKLMWSEMFQTKTHIFLAITVLHFGHEFMVEWFEHSAHRHIWRHGMRTTDFSLSWQMIHNRFRLLSMFTINVAACSFSFVSFSISIVHSLRIDASLRSTLSGDSLITLIRRRRAEILLAVE